MTETEKSSLDTLKAQLANVESQLDAHDTAWEQDVKKLQRVEIQLRELRERERFAVQLLRQILYPSPDDITDGQSIRLAAEKLIMENHQRNAAALRSAPPSGPSSDAIQHPTKYGPAPRVDQATGSSENTAGNVQMSPSLTQALFAKTNAGEERKDLARQGWPIPHHKLQELARRIEEGAEKVAYHGPQDLPSRSEPKKSRRWAWAENAFGDLTIPCRGEEDCPHHVMHVIIEKDRKLGRLHYHSPEKHAPPSPAREKGKAE